MYLSIDFEWIYLDLMQSLEAITAKALVFLDGNQIALAYGGQDLVKDLH